MIETIIKFLPLVSLGLNGLLTWGLWSVAQLIERRIAEALEGQRKAFSVELKAVQDEFATKAKEQADEIDHLDTRVGPLETEVRNLKEDIQGLPTKEDIARLEGHIKGVDGHVQSTAAGVGRLEGYFLQLGIGAAKA